jgi:sRNA-binding regulator protein Hfq
MSNQRYPQSKPNQQPGIRPPDLLELTQRLEAIEKLVRDNLDEKNQWSSKVREWIDKSIAIQLVDSTVVCGILKWVDRYTVCLQENENPSAEVTIVHKGAIAVIRRCPG